MTRLSQLISSAMTSSRLVSFRGPVGEVTTTLAWDNLS